MILPRRFARGNAWRPREALPRFVSVSAAARELSVGFTNGCFSDLLHPGHIAILRGAAQQPRSSRRRAQRRRDDPPGSRGRPGPCSARRRARRSSAPIDCVDLVVIFEEDTAFFDLILALLPDVLIKGADYSRSSIVDACPADIVRTETDASNASCSSSTGSDEIGAHVQASANVASAES